MSKKEIDKSYFLTLCIEQFYAEDHGCTIFKAIRHLYASPLYERLAAGSHHAVWGGGIDFKSINNR